MNKVDTTDLIAIVGLGEGVSVSFRLETTVKNGGTSAGAARGSKRSGKAGPGVRGEINQPVREKAAAAALTPIHSVHAA